MSHLQIENVAKHYAGRPVLRDIMLSLDSGEFVSLLGPSGCGKTTLLRIIAGFELPDAGAIRLKGQDITHVPAKERGLGMVFQAYSLFPNMTALDNVRFGLKVRRMSAGDQERRAKEMLDLVGLAEHLHKYPHQMSGGQQQRVALARALAIRPALLLLDEPLSALDAKVRVQLRDEIRNIQRETHVTTVFVTHDQEEALSISDRVVVMQHGVMAQVGAPAEIYGDPANIFVARFVGTATELAGRVVDAASGLVEIAGQTVMADRARSLSSGTPIHFLLRPESVRLKAANGGGHPAGTLAGTVSGQTFFGANTRLRVDLADHGHLFATLSNAEAETLRPGTPVNVSWDSDAPRVLARE